jgi:hypothetical protein
MALHRKCRAPLARDPSAWYMVCCTPVFTHCPKATGPIEPSKQSRLERVCHASVPKPLRKLWGKAWPCIASSLGPALLPKCLQDRLSRENSEGPCAHEKMVRPPHSTCDVAMSNLKKKFLGTRTLSGLARAMLSIRRLQALPSVAKNVPVTLLVVAHRSDRGTVGGLENGLPKWCI